MLAVVEPKDLVWHSSPVDGLGVHLAILKPGWLPSMQSSFGQRLTAQDVLVAVASKRCVNHSLHVRFHRLGATKLANSLGSLSDRKVAGTRLAVLGLPGRGQSKSLLGRLVRLLLGHRPLER